MGAAAGFALLSPVVASAAEAPTDYPTSMEVVVEGNAVEVKGECSSGDVEAEAGYRVPGRNAPIDHNVMLTNGKTKYVPFKMVSPGRYEAYMVCYEDRPGSPVVVRTFTVGKPAKPAPSTKPTQSAKPTQPAAKPAPQVGVKPQGAPQTGGGPADDESAATPLLAGGAIALVGAAGAGALVLRRRAARR
ncbi:hypothetical protein [Amycolatopsis sp. DG1A-15b]|uniref:hypothetical protein n=1 Tax=Amycolatopsis sp. DG1A-15b TaxID=3052846 RepID=UPI00255BDAE9|nr:hypothetical protein [Amycolatopsis sp. DG1A-15b]WIX93079.1 hypothetical protein QRY02_22620 [Amycolatopsis sp. DG1A-15b]